LSIDSKFTGIASVDLKGNAAGVPCVTEINPGRMFTTSYFFSTLAKSCAKDYYANIPYLAVKLGYKETIPEIYLNTTACLLTSTGYAIWMHQHT
jgi:hypothetical protein